MSHISLRVVGGAFAKECLSLKIQNRPGRRDAVLPQGAPTMVSRLLRVHLPPPAPFMGDGEVSPICQTLRHRTQENDLNAETKAREERQSPGKDVCRAGCPSP